MLTEADTTTPPEPTTSPNVQSAVLQALLEASGALLGTSIASWLETGEMAQSHRVLMGPAGTVCLVAVAVKTLPAYSLGEGGQA
jgi:hypothetical protein